jgi:hypothetical protein
MAGSKEIIVKERGATLERVAEWEQHRNLSGAARRQVLGTLVRLPKDPTESQTDKLLDLVGSHHRATLRKVLPKAEVTSIIGERHDRYTVEDLVADFGVDPVHTAFEYAKETGATMETEEGAQIEYDPVTILGATKLAVMHGFTTAEEVSGAIDHYGAEHELDHASSFDELVQIQPDEAEQRIGRPLA